MKRVPASWVSHRTLFDSIVKMNCKKEIKAFIYLYLSFVVLTVVDTIPGIRFVLLLTQIHNTII